MPASDHKAIAQKTLPGIFISYRRSDNPDATGRIYDRLVSEFGKARVFKDVDSIPLGQDFRGHLNEVVGGCAAVLAIIGPKWIDTRNSAGQRRLEDADDFVRIELEAALARDIPVVPVLVAHASMPGTADLPASLASMVFRQSIEVRPDPDFHNDATRLVSALRMILDPNAPQVQPHSTKPKPSPVPWLVGLAAITTLAAAAFAIPAIKHLRETPSPETRVDIVTPVTDDPGSFALSPDGRQIVFVAKSDGMSRLWLRSLAKATALPLAGTEGASAPFWSPDSRSIAFFAPGALKRIDLEGGQPQTLAPNSGIGVGSWSSKGVILFSTSRADPLTRVAATGGATTALPRRGKDVIGDIQPLFLPDGQHFVFLAVAPGSSAGTYLGSLDSGAQIQLTGEAGPVAYLPSGWLLRLRAGGTLVAQRLDLGKGTLVGEPVMVADGVFNLSASASGLIAYRVGGGGLRQLTWINRTGAVLGTVGDPDGSLVAPRVSPDGRQVAFSRDTQGKSDLWLQDGARASRVTFGSGGNIYPVWSPDGSQLAFLSAGGPTQGFYLKLTNGSQSQEQLLLSSKIQFLTSWSADGKYLLYFGFDQDTGADLRLLPVTGDRKPIAFLKTPAAELWGQFSPDGKWVAYQSNESGLNEVYVRRFIVPGGATDEAAVHAGQWQVSTGGGVFPTWRADGKELYFLNPAAMMMAAPIADTGSTVIPGTPVALFQTQVYGGGSDGAQGRQYDVAPDGRFMINRNPDAAPGPITLIQNWNPEAKN